MNLRANRLPVLALGATLSYGCLVLADYLLYEFGRTLPLSAGVKEYLTSHGSFDLSSHPDYRPWLRSFVASPGRPWKYEFRGDIVSVLGVATDTPRRTITLPVDDLGFINERLPAEAEVLFIGDSFGRSAGCSFEETIPSLFESITGERAYNASMQGYGPYQYLSLLRRLTDDAGDDAHRFDGKEVYVLVYVGNDVKENVDLYHRRAAAESRPALSPRLALETLRGISAKSADHAQGALRARLTGNETLDRDDIRAHTDGFYPVFVDLPPYRDVPLAFEPRIKSYRTVDWLDAERKGTIRGVLEQFRTTAAERDLTIRFVILPVNVQVLGPHVVHDEAASRYPFYDVYRQASTTFDVLATFMKDEIAAAGFEVLDVTAALRSEAARTQVFWPEDTHLTASGNRVVATEIVRDKIARGD
jgi:hypothetical protein